MSDGHEERERRIEREKRKDRGEPNEWKPERAVQPKAALPAVATAISWIKGELKMSQFGGILFRLPQVWLAAFYFAIFI
jgi:hypothetical protein